MMLVDFHTHAFADSVAEKAMTHLVRESGYKAYHDGTIRGLRRSLLDAGVDLAVVLSIATRPGHVPVINDWVIEHATAEAARVAAEGTAPTAPATAKETANPADPADPASRDSPSAPPNRRRSPALVFFGTVHPKFEGFETEIARLRAAGIRGVKFHPNYQEFHPDAPGVFPLFRALADAGMIALVHAGFDIAYPDAPGSPERLARLAAAVPDLDLVCAHFGGWRHWDDVERHLLGAPNVYLDTSFTLDDLPDERFVAMARRHGIERILFATDSPWRDTRDDLAALDRLPLTPDERRAIRSGNALRLLGIAQGEPSAQ